MPIYEYECSNCHHQFDLLQKMSDEPVKQCPQCQKDTAKRLVSAAGFQLKGTGWYVTDFKDKGTAKDKSKTGANASHTKSTSAASTNKKKGEKG